MYSSTALLALVAAVGPALVSADDNAASVSTLSFKNAFVSSGIVPEVIPALDPAVSFYASYRAADGHNELLVPGSSLTLAEAGQLPIEFSVESLNNATNITAQTRYLIYLLDADAPSRSSPTARNLRHYLAGNYTLQGSNSTVLATAQRLSIPDANRRPFTVFSAPDPQPNTGVHRYIYALYTQPARWNTQGFEASGMEAAVQNWNLSRWRGQLGLGPAIGATYFVIDTNANGGNGTSKSAGGGSGAAGLSAYSLYVSGLGTVAAFFAMMLV